MAGCNTFILPKAESERGARNTIPPRPAKRTNGTMVQVQALCQYFQEKKALATYQTKLHGIQKQPRESVTKFIAALKKLAALVYP